MLVVVNQPHINDFTIQGTISPSSLDQLKELFGDSLSIKESDNEWVNIEDTDWYKGMKSLFTPSSNLSYYRKKKKLTQTELGAMIGTKKQVISDMEHERKSISKAMAKKIAKALDCPVALFI